MSVEDRKAGETLDDWCAPCKTVRRHTVLATRIGEGPLRVICDYCGSQHNFRGGGTRHESRESREPRGSSPSPVEAFSLVSERERSQPPMAVSDTPDLEMLLRRIIREECGLTPVVPADKWRGGEMVLRPGKPGLQEKVWPIETFFHKVTMLRNRLRVLEQQVNSLEVPEELKVKMQGYITACYGTLTSFNVLFASEEDRFRGSGGAD